MSGDRQVFDNAMNQGHSAAWDEEWAEAASFYRTAINEFPDNVVALSSLALALYELQKFQESLDYYQRAARLSPNDPVPVQKIAEISERIGNLANGTKAYMDLAEIYARNRDVEKAIHSWSRVVALNPENMAAHTRLALVYERLGRTSEAMIEYISIASLLQFQGNLPKAIQTMKHALQVVPNSKEANLALNMLQSGKSLPKPSRPQGGTGPLMSTPSRQTETATSAETRPRLDPIQDAKQKALSMLAELLFEQEEAQNPQNRKSPSIFRGTGELRRVQIDQAKINLHLSQAIDLQSHGDDAQATPELEKAIAAGLDN